MTSTELFHTAPDTTTLRAGDVRVGPEPDGVLPRRRFPTAVRVVLGALAMLLAAISPLVLAVIPDIESVFEEASGPVQVLMTLGMHSIALLTALLLVWLLMRHVDRRPFAHVGWTWNRRSLPALVLGLGATIALALAAAVAVEAVTPTRAPETGGAPGWLAVLTAVSAAFLLQGIGEELVWRGYVLQTLRTSPVVSVYISAVGFALLHLVSQGGQQNAWEHVVYLAIPFGFAILAGALVLRTGSLWSAVGVHGGFHLTNLIAGQWLGIGTSPLMWAVQGGVLALLGMVLMHRRPQG